MSERRTALRGRKGGALETRAFCAFCAVIVKIRGHAREVKRGMMGSKYDEETREKAIALVASGKSYMQVSKIIGVPKSTVADWYNRRMEDDEDFLAARAEARRASIKKCGKIIDRAMNAIDLKVSAASRETKLVREGIEVLRRAARDGYVSMTEDDVKKIREIIGEYTGVGLRDLSTTLKDIAAHQDKLERDVMGGDAVSAVQVTLDGDAEDFAG